MASRPKPKLLAQGKPRMLGGSRRAWRVRLHAPGPGSNKYQVYVRAPAGEGEPWKRVLRRAASEDEARKIFAQAEAALDSEQATPVGADVRATRTIRILGEEYLKDSIERLERRGPAGLGACSGRARWRRRERRATPQRRPISWLSRVSSSAARRRSWSSRAM